MNSFVLLIFVVVVGAGSFLVGLIGPSNLQKNNQSEAFPTEPCTETGAPILSDAITFQGIGYNLIKKNARIPGPNPKNEEDKFQNGTQLIGDTTDGKKVYQLKTTNFFGEPNNNNIIYILKEQKDGSSFFDIYLKAGIAIPDFVKNCKTTGGTIAFTPADATQFPPSAFNTTQIVNPTKTLPAPAYVYTSNKNTFDFVKGLPGVQNVGSLSAAAKQYPLYFHLGTIYLVDSNDTYEYLPTANTVDVAASEEKSLQMKKITFIKTPFYSWWTPECKPAIYLYPPEKTEITVRVYPKGFFTLTIPDYGTDGWHVTAYPNGQIEADNKIYPYLYYESKIKDSEIKIPSKGFVIAFDKLQNLYEEILPKLGLLDKERADFIEYWQKALPYSPYYFVGIVERTNVDHIEKLTVNPQPSSIIRVRFYFEPLDKQTVVDSPSIVTPKREGFTVVEWGGMVKVDKNHPFTCSQ